MNDGVCRRCRSGGDHAPGRASRCGEVRTGDSGGRFIKIEIEHDGAQSVRTGVSCEDSSRGGRLQYGDGTQRRHRLRGNPAVVGRGVASQLTVRVFSPATSGAITEVRTGVGGTGRNGDDAACSKGKRRQCGDGLRRRIAPVVLVASPQLSGTVASPALRGSVIE